jgi:hypothetical protein
MQMINPSLLEFLVEIRNFFCIKISDFEFSLKIQIIALSNLLFEKNQKKNFCFQQIQIYIIFQ